MRRTLRNCRYSMVEKGVLTVTVQLYCTIVCERPGRVRPCRESACGQNCAVESIRARLEEMRAQGAKDDAPAILLKMDVAKKAAAVRMPLSLFPDIGGMTRHRGRVSVTVLRGSACFVVFEHWVKEAHALALTR